MVNKKISDLAYITSIEDSDLLTAVRLSETAENRNKKILGSDLKNELGQQVVFQVENQTGSLIPKGSVISPDTSTLIVLADATDKEKSRIIAVANEDIADGSTGFAIRLGNVVDIDTSAYPAGTIMYLSATTPGAITNVTPDDGAYAITVGYIITQDAVNGVLRVDTTISELTVEVTDVNGFPTEQRTNTTLAFDDGTRTFTIAPTGTDFHYYILGDKINKTSSVDVIISDVEGLHAIYFDGDVLTDLANPSDVQIDTIFRTKSIVSYIYWDQANSVHTYFADERHGINMAYDTHTYLHFTRGAQFLSGLGLGDIVIDDGSLDTHAQFSVASGTTADEDLAIIYPTINSITGLPIYYLSGASAYSRRVVNSGFSVLDDITAGVGATGRLVYNEYTGATWQLTTVDNSDYVLCHVFAVNGYNGEDKQIAIIGQNAYPNASQARAAASVEISNILIQFPFQEIVPIATVIFKTRDTYANSVKARIILTDLGENYVDWRTTDLAQGANPTSHANLTNLEWTSSNHTGTASNVAGFDSVGASEEYPLTDFVLTTGDQSISGTKTFNDNVLFNGDKIAVDHRISTSDYIISMNSGETGAGITGGYNYIEVDRGSLEPYASPMFRESDETIRLGGFFISFNHDGDTFPLNTPVRGVTSGTKGLVWQDSGLPNPTMKLKQVIGTGFLNGETIEEDVDVPTLTGTLLTPQLINDNTVALAGRENTPLDGGIAVWNATNFIFESKDTLTDGTKATTQLVGDNSTKIATTEYIDRLNATNIEILTGNKTLQVGVDDPIQVLDPGGSSRTINILNTDAYEGATFEIANNNVGTTETLSVSLNSVFAVSLSSGQMGKYIFDGSSWQPFSINSGSTDTDTQSNVTIGNGAISSGTECVTIGESTSNNGTYSTVIGRAATSGFADNAISIGGLSRADAEGAFASGYFSDAGGIRSVALGYYANAATDYSFVKGAYGTAVNYGEESRSLNNLTLARGIYVDNGYYYQSSDATPVEIYLRGVSSQRYIVQASSAIKFKFNIVARDNVHNDIKAWEVTGAIKRDASNNTAIVGTINYNIVAEDTAASTWDVTISADDTNESIKLVVTGEAGTTIRWAAKLETIEIRF